MSPKHYIAAFGALFLIGCSMTKASHFNTYERAQVMSEWWGRK